MKRYAALVALLLVFLALVALACNAPDVPRSRDIMQPRAAGDDVAAGKTCDRSDYNIYDCSNALDSNDSTRWSTAGGNNKWISVDLGATIYISNTRVLMGSVPNYACTYSIQSSSDNTNWTDLATSLQATDLTTAVNSSARYWRIYCTGAPAIATRVYTWSLFEGTPPTATPTATSAATNTPTEHADTDGDGDANTVTHADRNVHSVAHADGDVDANQHTDSHLHADTTRRIFSAAIQTAI